MFLLVIIIYLENVLSVCTCPYVNLLCAQTALTLFQNKQITSLQVHQFSFLPEVLFYFTEQRRIRFTDLEQPLQIPSASCFGKDYPLFKIMGAHSKHKMDSQQKFVNDGIFVLLGIYLPSSVIEIVLQIRIRIIVQTIIVLQDSSVKQEIRQHSVSYSTD